MRTVPAAIDRDAIVARLDRAAGWAVLGIVPGMLHAFAVAEVLIALIGLGWLARCTLRREWGWLREGWVPVAAAWWAWLVVCSVPGIGEGGFGSLVQALAVVRYPVLVVALERQVLADPRVRRWLWAVLAASAAYIGLQALLQFATGRNLAGYPRWGDGELTGPFQKPRAAAPLARMLPPVLLVPVGALLEGRPDFWRMAAAAGLAALAVAVMVLIGQRMPVLLTVLALLVAAVLLPRLRVPVVAALVAGGVLVASSALVSPPTFYRLVTKFGNQMENFPSSPYGLLAARAVAIAEDHPWTGRGFDGFRSGCADPRYFRGWTHGRDPADDGGGLAGCNIHPHNPYLQAVTDAGLPGLVLYVAMVLAWLVALGRGLWQGATPLRVGLFAAFVVAHWPLASTSSAFAVETAGLAFLLLGFGLAEARARPVR